MAVVDRAQGAVLDPPGRPDLPAAVRSVDMARASEDRLLEAGRRTQRERSEGTIAALLDAARTSFAEVGFAATSLDAVTASAGVTKGALYHHFPNKRALFRAVYEREEQRLVEQALRVAIRTRDPWDAFEAGLAAYFEASSHAGVQRITLLDAPSVLGPEEAHSIAVSGWSILIEGGLARAVAAGELEPRPLGPLADLLYGAICQAAMIVARSEDQAAARTAYFSELRAILRGLARGA
jgi:AcrR family transcriptional regulator